MNILRTYIRIPPSSGGMENHIKILTDIQNEQGFVVDVAFNEGFKLNENDIHILKKFKLYPTLKSPFVFFVFYIFLLIELLLNGKRYDVLHIHGDWSSFLFAPLIQKVTKSKKVYFSFHGKIHDNFIHTKVLPFLIKKSCEKIFVTGYESFSSLSRTGKAIFQPSGVKELFYAPKNVKGNDRVIIVTVTFLRPQKNVITFLRVAQNFSEYHFQIIGDGHEEINLKKFVTNNNLKNVEFLGNRKPEEIKQFLDNADIFLFTSKEEGTPTAVMEAMACGVPIVTSNAGGINSIVKDFENGFVIYDFETPESYTEKIVEILNCPGLKEKMRSNNKNKAKLFSWEKVARNISEYILENDKR